MAEREDAPLVHEEAAMGWAPAGITIFTFAAPSAVMAVPFAIGNAGFLGGLVICLIITGMHVLGRPGRMWGNTIQLGNFCLFMPCALRFCALSLAGIGMGIPGFGGCIDYYVFVVAFICLLTTQVRSFNNVEVFTVISLCCTIGMVVSMLVAALQFDHDAKIPAKWIGNPEPEAGLSLVRLASGCTISAWAFVPAFLTVELSTCMAQPKDFKKSLYLAGALIVAVFALAGTVVVARWGYNVGEVIAVTPGVGAWLPGAAINTVFNACQLGGNFVCYMLDSVPLGRFCQKTWAPDFKDTWSAGDVARYLTYTLPAFLLALFLSVFTPNVNTLLDFTTALTTPWVSQIYPAVLYWKFKSRGAGRECAPDPLKASEKALVVVVFAVGCFSFLACSLKAVGYLAFDELRPSFEVGCEGWMIWQWTQTR
ncbi:unnamed protein product [Effrenium voratum]|uniref:Amino acid transporter transmembrane domain-containing protein n=1 Tax=Effrenium voratum TaxID=2562239 RepID=A0AA36N7C6_9DINO|nr:unnamed protein product [Effrenium voratum]